MAGFDVVNSTDHVVSNLRDRNKIVPPHVLCLHDYTHS